MEETKISTQLEYPQISEVFKNWKKITTWGKQWNVYSNESVKKNYIVYLAKIDTAEKKLTFRVREVNSYSWEYISFDVPIRKDFTQKMFEKQIYSAVFSKLIDLEFSEIFSMDKYQEYLEKKEWYENYNNVKEEVLDFFNSVTGSNLQELPDEIVDSTVNWYLENCSEYLECVHLKNCFADSKKFVIFANIYKHFISLIPYDDVRQQYENKIKEHRKEYEIRRSLRQH